MFPVFFLLLVVLSSCASRQAVVIPPPTMEPTSPAESPAERTLSPMESAIRRIKQNSPDVKKYFIIDETGDILTKGEIEQFEIIYDLKKLLPEGPERFSIPFFVESLTSGETRQETLSWRPQRDASGILLAFDDNYQEAWENIFDLFDRYGARATFFVQGKYEEYSAFCAEALQRGHDVGYHSINHLDLRKVSPELFRTETQSQTELFRDAGVPLTSFAYPFGFSDLWMHEELLQSYKILRGYGVTFRLYSSAVIREGQISSRAIDTILFKKDEDFKAMIDIMLRTLKFIGGDLILPLTSHDISDTAVWGITPHRLEYLLQSANDLQLNFYRYRDFSD